MIRKLPNLHVQLCLHVAGVGADTHQISRRRFALRYLPPFVRQEGLPLTMRLYTGSHIVPKQSRPYIPGQRQSFSLACGDNHDLDSLLRTTRPKWDHSRNRIVGPSNTLVATLLVHGGVRLVCGALVVYRCRSACAYCKSIGRSMPHVYMYAGSPIGIVWCNSELCRNDFFRAMRFTCPREYTPRLQLLAQLL